MFRKRIMLAVFAAFGLSIALMTGCTAVEKVAGKLQDAAVHMRTLKAKGCSVLSPGAREAVVALIKLKVKNYPENGICDPNWLRDYFISHPLTEPGE